MKKKLILAVALALCLTLTTTIVAMTPTLAAPNTSNIVNYYYNGGMVTINLPPNGTNHPIDLAIGIVDGDFRSTFGAFDLLHIRLWIPQAESYMPVAFISDNPQQLEFGKRFWNNTPIWKPPILEGAILVEDNDLEVYVDAGLCDRGHKILPYTGRCYYGHPPSWKTSAGDVIVVNLTKAVYISLPFNSQPSGSSRLWGNLSFTLPPFTMVLREIGEAYYLDESGGPSFSGITYTTKGWKKPAWVEVEIPSWMHYGSYMGVGSLSKGMTDQFTLPP